MFTDLKNLVLFCVIIWSLGSYTEEFLGWRMLIVFSGFQGLIGYAYEGTLVCFLIGCFFAQALMLWPDPTNPVIYRKITLVIYLIIGLIFILCFINFPK